MIPQRDDLVGEGVDRNTECSCQTEICEFQLAFLVDQKVLGLEISMENPVLVAERNAPQQLVHERFDGKVVELAVIASRIHVSLQVLVHEFENEHQLVFGMDHVVEGEDVLMFELFH